MSETVQRQNVRNNVRFRCRFPVEIKSDRADIEYRRLWDLSASGLSWASRAKYEPGERYHAYIDMGEWSFSAEVEIVRMTPLIAGVRVGARFINLPEELEHRITKYAYELELEERKLKRGTDGEA